MSNEGIYRVQLPARFPLARACTRPPALRRAAVSSQT